MTTPTAPEPTAPAPASANPGQQPAAQTFSQSDVDRIIAERLARERKHYEGFDEIKAKAEKFDKIEAQNATELEKATKKAADDARTETMTAANKRLVRAEVKAYAAAVGFHDPRDAAALLAGEFAGVKVDDNGEVDDAAVRALVDQLAKDKPHLIKSASGSTKPLPGQGTPSNGSVSGRQAGLAEARKRFGEPQKIT